MLPLSLSLSSRQLRLLTSLGTGVLVGTALIVIIPEGIETLYSAGGSGHSHAERSLASLGRRNAILGDSAGVLGHNVQKRSALAAPLDIGVTSREDFAMPEYLEDDPHDENDHDHDGTPDHSEDKVVEDADHDHDHSDEEGHEPDPHAWVGISLITGFVLMYLVDTLPRQASASAQPQRFHVNLNSFSFTRSASTTSETAETPSASSFSDAHSNHSRPSSTTVGLVIHAAADGIALGASSTTTSRLSFIIFIALMIHKAPAAFGLTTTLLKQGLSKRAAKAHLIIFSMAAPIGALFTWGAAHILGYSSSTLGGSMGTEFATGVLLLFSGGTFLYVAMHTMQENGGEHDHGEQANGYAGVPMDMYESQSSAPRQKEGGGLTDTLACVAGMLLPMLTQFGHAH